MCLVQPYYCHESLGHRIELSYSIEYYEDYNFQYNKVFISENSKGTRDYDKIRALVKEEVGEADLMVLLGYDEYDVENGKFKGGSTGYVITGCGVFKPELQN